MKTPISFSFALLGALLAFGVNPLWAANKEHRPYAFNVSSVENISGVQVKLGASEATLVHALGLPSHKISSDVWVYIGYHAEDVAMSRLRGCDRLLVTVDGGVVRDIKFVNPRGERVVTAQLRKGSVGVFYAIGD